MKTLKPPLQEEGSQPRPRYYRITYSNAGAPEDARLFKCRDGVAFCEVAAELPALGYQFGTTLYLYPLDVRKLSEFPAFQPSDLLVLTTRPPLHDEVGLLHPQRKKIHAAKTELEAALFLELAKYFDYCTRKFVRLSKHGLGHLRVEDRRKWEEFEVKEYLGEKEYCGAEIQRFMGGAIKAETGRHSTVAFFLRANKVPDLGCDFLASFGMDGFSTLIWNRIIRQQHPDWLAKPGFVMAELIFKARIPDKPLTPEFVDDGACVEVRLLT